MYKYKNYILDLGGVLVDIDLGNLSAGLEQAGCTRAYQQAHKETLTRWATDYERGLLSTQQLLDNMKPLCHPHTTREELLRIFNSVIRTTTRERLELVKRLATGSRVFLLSNTNEAHWQYIHDHVFPACGFTPEELFERIFLSYEMGVIKPDLRIYQMVIEATGIEPAETLFLDDNKDNLQAASILGIHTRLTPSLTASDIL